MALKSQDWVIPFLNIITYRLDALLGNIADCLVILLSTLLLYYRLNPGGALPSSIFADFLLIVVLVHFMYVPVYVINDVFDYNQMLIFDKGRTQPQYSLRPVLHFHGRRHILALLVAWYLGAACLIAAIVGVPILLALIFACSFAGLSYARSQSKPVLNLPLFGSLRFLKYVSVVELLNIVLFGNLWVNQSTISVVTIVTPYAIYSVLSYSGMLSKLYKGTSKKSDSIASSLMPKKAVFEIEGGLLLPSMLESISFSYGFAVFPSLLFRYLAWQIAGGGTDFRSHLNRTAIIALLMVIWSVYLVAMMFHG